MSGCALSLKAWLYDLGAFLLTCGEASDALLLCKVLRPSVKRQTRVIRINGCDDERLSELDGTFP